MDCTWATDLYSDIGRGWAVHRDIHGSHRHMLLIGRTNYSVLKCLLDIRSFMTMFVIRLPTVPQLNQVSESNNNNNWTTTASVPRSDKS